MLESPLESKEIKSVSPKENQSWIHIGRTEAAILGHLMQRANSLEKTLLLGKTEGRRRRGREEDEMVGWHHWLSGCEFEQTLEDSEGQEAWHPTVHGVTKSWTWLRDCTKIQGTVLGTREAAMLPSINQMTRDVHSSRKRLTVNRKSIYIEQSQTSLSTIKTTKLDKGMQRDWARGYFR